LLVLRRHSLWTTPITYINFKSRGFQLSPQVQSVDTDNQLHIAHSPRMIGLSSRLLLLVAALEVSPPPPSRHPRVVGPGRKEQICVVGAGPAGVHMAYSLKKRGYSSVVVLERTDRVGGKCLDSHYRGVVWPLGAGVTVAHYSRNIIPLAAEFGFNDYTNAGNGSEFLGKVFEIVTR
jgi:hypothetical protein